MTSLDNKSIQSLTTGMIIGGSIGLLGGLLASRWVQSKRHLDADSVLANVKKAFLEEGPIEGSWIQFTQQPLQKFALKTETYTGGITRFEDDQLVQYEFVADAHTGSVIDIYRL